jgi:hypothetical protein
VRRVLAYVWASPGTLLGLLFAVPALLGRGRAGVVNGVLEISGGAAALFLARAVPLPGGASAMTLGHVVLGRDAAALERTRRHERVHVAQYERWGPLFIPAYLLVSLALLVRGRDAWAENPFEREAEAGSGTMGVPPGAEDTRCGSTSRDHGESVRWRS